MVLKLPFLSFITYTFSIFLIKNCCFESNPIFFITSFTISNDFRFVSISIVFLLRLHFSSISVRITLSDKDIFLTPAMNVRMWEHPSTKENINKLKSFGYKIIGPDIGDMACEEFGEGKMKEPLEIIKQIENYFNNLKKK